MVLALASVVPTARAGAPLPAGGHFTAGAGTIGAAANGLTINQTSAHGIIDWQSFSIGAGYVVQIDNGAGATLNRVTGSDLSSIAGMLRGTGSVYLVNPNGLIIMP
ncbi:MAG: filamentous hemagglutinin N-terminal domain-containing protein, partial [Rhizomicrobium sp.]